MIVEPALEETILEHLGHTFVPPFYHRSIGSQIVDHYRLAVSLGPTVDVKFTFLPALHGRQLRRAIAPGFLAVVASAVFHGSLSR